MQPIRIGPGYIFRNTCRVTTSITDGVTIYKLGDAGDFAMPLYLFHNTVDSSPNPNNWDGVVGAIQVRYLNNILKHRGTMIFNIRATSTFDYNIYQLTNPGCCSFTFNWNGTTTHDDLADFQSGTGQEANGFTATMTFLNTALEIDGDSPAVDQGVALANFNGANSAWPNGGSAPDIGFFEVSADAVAPAAPTQVRILTPGGQ
jgi:hypothetical protein